MMDDSVVERLKYPRTPHLPHSGEISDDDTQLTSVVHLIGEEVVVTEKLDGENTTIYSGGYCHARSVDARSHPSQSYVRALAGKIGHVIPKGMRICGESLNADWPHSILYPHLPRLGFYVFSIWDADLCLDWYQTRSWCKALGLDHVQTIYLGEFNMDRIHRLWLRDKGPEVSEGYVIRLVCAFRMSQFDLSVAKYVRPNHVQTSEHWRYGN